jgi:hypothetical protein
VPANATDRILDPWASALEIVRSDPALSFTCRRLCLLPDPQRRADVIEVAASLRASGQAESLARFIEALAHPAVAGAVFQELPEPPPPRRSRWFWIFLAASIFLHPILIALALLLWIWYSELPPARDIPQPRQIRVTLVPTAPPPPPPPAPEPTPRVPFLDTTGLPQIDQPDPRAAFESEVNTAARSRQAGTGNPALPSQQGEVRPGIELFNADYNPATANQPQAPTPDQPSEPKPPTPKPEEAAAAKPNAPLQEQLRTSTSSRIQTGEKSEAEKIREREKTLTTSPPSQTAESTAPPAAFSAFKRQNRIEGGATAGEVNSAAARESDIGRYKAKLYRAIGSRWYAYVRQDDGKIGIGVVRLRFYVRHDGVILPPEIISGGEHAALLAVSRRSIMEVSGQLEPFPPNMRQQLGEGYYEEVSFSIY